MEHIQTIKHPSGKLRTAYDQAVTEAEHAVHVNKQPLSKHPLASSTYWIRHIEHTVFAWEARAIAATALRAGVGQKDTGITFLIPVTSRGEIPMTTFTVTAPAPTDGTSVDEAVLRAARERMTEGQSILDATDITNDGTTITANVTVAKPAEKAESWLSFGNY